MSKQDRQLALNGNGNAARDNDATTRTRARIARTTARWQSKFLKALRQAPSVKHACKVAGVSRWTAYRNRQENEEFAKQWEDAIGASVDALEHRAFELALAGDSSLISFMLKCHRPEIYRETSRHELAVAAGVIFLPQKGAAPE